MNLKKLIFANSDCYKEGMAKKQFIKPVGIMLHSTGANNPWLKRYVGPDDGLLGKNRYGNHWNKHRTRRVCYHAFVGKLNDGSIASYQVLPWDLRGWHSGSGKNGNGNSLGYIGICICEDNLKDKAYAMAAYKEACELSAHICELYNLDPMKIIDHAEGYRLRIASNHGDVRHWLGKYGITLDRIRQDVKALMAKPEPKPTPTPKPTEEEKVKEWQKKNTLKLGSKNPVVGYLQAYLMSNGYTDDNKMVADDDFGSLTDKMLRQYQEDKKLFVDGICGPQTWRAIMK
ncbi:MAG TPA: N-acetylmuramoyl-L-alanine amidase [Clostridiaceae bacterium]|nr:N-acetylmuramoyl-L-alanine amidase [Clostridiaceae bacterium]